MNPSKKAVWLRTRFLSYPSFIALFRNNWQKSVCNLQLRDFTVMIIVNSEKLLSCVLSSTHKFSICPELSLQKIGLIKLQTEHNNTHEMKTALATPTINFFIKFVSFSSPQSLKENVSVLKAPGTSWKYSSWNTQYNLEVYLIILKCCFSCLSPQHISLLWNKVANNEDE